MGAVSLAPALFALRGGDLAAYHGVEHKSIAAYEQDGEAADADKEHDRCGSNLVAPMLGAAAVGNVAARRAGLRGPLAEAGVAVGQRRGGGGGVRLRGAPRRLAPVEPCCAAPATRSSAWSARRSPPRSSWRWAAPRSPRSCGWRERRIASTVRTRLDPAVFRLPVERIREGYYTDAYFNLAKELLEEEGRHPRVTMQVFQKGESVLGGIDEAIAVLKECAGRDGARRLGARLGPAWTCARCTRATRSRRTRP